MLHELVHAFLWRLTIGFVIVLLEDLQIDMSTCESGQVRKKAAEASKRGLCA